MIKPEDVKNLAIILPYCLGDMVMSFSFIHACQKIYSNAKIDIIIKKRMVSFPFPVSFSKSVSIIPEKSTPFMTGLSVRHKKYDLLWLLTKTTSAYFKAFFSGAKMSIGYRRSWRSFLIDKACANPPHKKHMVLEYLDLLSSHHKIKVEYTPPSLSVDDSFTSENWWKKYSLNGSKYILIAPFASFNGSKSWALNNFKKLALIFSKKGYRIVISGSTKDKEESKYFEDVKNCLNLVGKTDVNQLVALISKSSLTVSLDSGIGHVAAALKAKQVVVFGGFSHPRWVRPLNELAKINCTYEHCSPCFKRICMYGHYNCVKNIKVSEVLENCLQLLNA